MVNPANPWVGGVFHWFYGHPLRHVRIREDRVHEFAAVRGGETFTLPEWRGGGIYPQRDSDFVEYIFWVTAVNFCFRHAHAPYHKYAARDMFGSMAIGSCALEAQFTKMGRISCDVIDGICKSLHRAKRFFHRHRLHTLPLIGERVRILEEISMIVRYGFGGRILNIFESARWDAWNLVNLCVDVFPHAFSDSYDTGEGAVITFAKKAQLLAVLYEGRAQSSRGYLKPLASMETVGPICDYAVPVALYALGCIEYSYELEEKIRQHSVIPEGSAEEIEIRVATCIVVQRLLLEINAVRAKALLPPIHMGHMDYFLWTLGRHQTLPHHITQTTRY